MATRGNRSSSRLSPIEIIVAAAIGMARGLFGHDAIGPKPVQGASSAARIGGRGRTADAHADIPSRGWRDIAWRVFHGVQNDRVLLVSAGVTFYGLLALFPATAALVSLYGLFADTATINDHLQLASGFLPEGALAIIGDQVKRIAFQGRGTIGITFAGTLFLSLWSANAGTKSIFDALNIAYKEVEKRSFVRLTLASLAFTLGVILFALIALAGIVIIPVVFSLTGIGERTGTAWMQKLRWPVLYVLILFVLACLYRYGPSRARPRWRWVTWGSAIAAAVWILGSLLLSWYVANFGTYNATYGSLGAVIGFMIWLWLSTMVVLMGGEINAEIEHQTARDTTEGHGKPMGTRGARMADELGRSKY